MFKERYKFRQPLAGNGVPLEPLGHLFFRGWLKAKRAAMCDNTCRGLKIVTDKFLKVEHSQHPPLYCFCFGN